MADDYVKRSDVHKAFQPKYAPAINKTFAAMIDSVPAADVVEVRHGRWIKDDETGEPICSVCHSGKPTRAVCSSVIEHKLNNHEIRYCYYCGAKMDGGKDE